MSNWIIGERIGAIRNADEQTAYMFGFGTYQGEEVPPDDVSGPFGRLGLFGIRNPKLVMDDGTVVWGCESWWGDTKKITRMVGNRRIEIVKPERTPATEEDRQEAARINEAAKSVADEIVGAIKAAQVKTTTPIASEAFGPPCEDCDNPISRRRMEAVPTATRCAPCQEKFEREEAENGRGPLHRAMDRARNALAEGAEIDSTERNFRERQGGL